MSPTPIHMSIQQMLSSDKGDFETLGDVPVFIALDHHFIHFLPPSLTEEKEIVPICTLDITFTNYARLSNKKPNQGAKEHHDINGRPIPPIEID
jgi:hypothetical protein